jgi:hypothetical protein
MPYVIRRGTPLLLVLATALPVRGEDPSPSPVATASSPTVTPAVRECLDRISPDSLRGHLSFLASDLLEGRGTPSRGLDIAAEYIAAQFRRAALEPIGDDGYFQTADWKYLAPDPGSFVCSVAMGLVDQTIAVGENEVSGALTGRLDLRAVPVIKVDAANPEALKALRPEDVAGKVVLAEIPHPFRTDRARMAASGATRVAFLQRMQAMKPALVVDVDRDPEGARGLRLDDPGGRRGRNAAGLTQIMLHSPRLAQAFDTLPAGPTPWTLTVQSGEPRERTVKVRNVVGLLRGSEPGLKSSYVLLSAHYDHLGIGPANAAGDRVFNGANDDGSGTVSVIEIAGALATLKPRPRRSLVFLAFYGEEHGLVGSRYYAEHPVVPLAETVAAVNLEQVGRTDDSDGPRVAGATVTGYDYSDVGAILHRAGAAVGVDVTRHPVKSDAYFGASDNASLARAGVPAHTLSVAYMFPDYHGADDEWDRIDFANMARVDRMAALGLLLIADGPAPAWDKDNPKAAPYRNARPSTR